MAFDKSRETVKEELALAAGRHDVRPVEAPNAGFSLEHHERATVASAKREMPVLALPLSKPTIAAADHE